MTCGWVSFKPEWAFNVIAHVRDWEHAETVRRHCSSGQLEALHSEWSARAQGHVWVSQVQSWDPLAQRGRKSGLNQDTLSPSGREHQCARVNVKRRRGANPRTGFRQVPLTPWWKLVREMRRWYWVGYDEAKEATRSDPDWHPSDGRVGSLDKWPMRKGQSRRGFAESLGKKGDKAGKTT